MKPLQVETRESPIHGVGVFAVRAFRTGDGVFQTSLFEVYPHMAFGTVRMQATAHVMEWSVLRWVNHGCVANCVIIFKDQRVYLVAQRPISCGEELLCDYFTTEEAIPKPFVCNCGNCVGTYMDHRNLWRSRVG